MGSSIDGGVAVPHVKPGDGGDVQGDVPKSVHGGESGGDLAKPPKPDPQGPKCVQLKMNPGWRSIRGVNGKRRRGDLADGQEDGARWGWPADRPEFCRFVLYKENCDTVNACVKRF